MAITVALVKELRERTGLGMMDCKKALVQADGDINKAIEDLRKSSGMKAAKKAGRIAAEGVVLAQVADNGSFGVMIEINSETDFVTKDQNFLAFAQVALAMAFEQKEGDVASLLASGLESKRQALVQKIGENIGVRRIEVVAADADQVIASYIHNKRIGVLVTLQGGDADTAKDVAMHIAAVNPLVVKAEDLSADVLAKEREIYLAQARDSGKPADIIDKMVSGRMGKYVAEISLLEQQFVKDPDIKVSALLSKANADVLSFCRYEVGEGIAKEEVDFAAEVAAQVNEEDPTPS